MKYRIYYAERQIGPGRWDLEGAQPLEFRRPSLHSFSPQLIHATEWEDEIEAASLPGALDEFFREHAGSLDRVRWVDDEDRAHQVMGLNYDPKASYIWVEDDRLMEFQGIDPAEAGQTVCPFCSGKGTVDESVVSEYYEDLEVDNEHQADIRG